MNCTHTEKLIPLYVGGDLDSRQALQLRLHIENCGHCREIAAGFEESRDWLRGLDAPQFDEATFDDLRAAVHTHIVQPQARTPRFDLFALLSPGQYAIAGSLAALLLIAALVIYNYRHRSAAPHVVNNHQAGGGIRQPPEEPKIEETAETGSHSGTSKHRRPQHKLDPASIKPSSQVIIEWPEPPKETAEVTIEQPADSINPATDPEMLRIEFQTADPNIRIIWLVAKNPGMSPFKSGGRAAGNFGGDAPEEDGGPK